MIKHIRLPMNFQVAPYPNQTVYTVHVDARTVGDWCLGLCLLRDDLVEALHASQDHPKIRLHLKKVEDPDGPSRCRESVPGTLEFRLSEGALGYLHMFLLKYYRDGYAEVEHVDLDANSDDGKEQESTLTFKAADAAAPVSAEEARRRLGLA